ncbi:MAG: MotA/TolQ/ExbB proton channel family protein [Kofleriaceae bacterium]
MNITDAFLSFALLGADWVLWLLVVLSIVSLGIMIDRWRWFRGRDASCDAFVAELRAAAARGELDEVCRRHADDATIAIQVACRGLEARAGGAAAAAEVMLAERARWRRAADRNLIVLGTLGNNVPFVGLFGTVLGVIRAFDDLGGKAADSEQLVMTGIAEALVATAVGLLVAIPAVIAFNYFGRRLKVALGGADECAHSVLAIVHAGAVATPVATADEAP